MAHVTLAIPLFDNFSSSHVQATHWNIHIKSEVIGINHIGPISSGLTDWSAAHGHADTDRTKTVSVSFTQMITWRR